MSDFTIPVEKLKEMIEDVPEAFADCPECPECGRPMVGQKTEDGPYCAWGCNR